MSVRKLVLTSLAIFMIVTAGVVNAQGASDNAVTTVKIVPINVEQIDVAVTTTSTTTTTTTTTTLAPTTTTTTLVPAGSRCEELAPIALSAGWPQELLVDVLDEAYNESRCLNVIPGHPQYNGHDHGPLQINEPTWRDEVTDFYGDWSYIDIPYYNFAWAWEMYKWHDAHGYCGFKPWTRRCRD